MKKEKYNVCVVGVGAVGEEMLRVLYQRKFPIGELKVLARRERDIVIDGRKYSVKEISPQAFESIDIALFAGTEGEKGAAVTYAKEAIARGAIVIDNGADFRMDPNVPLVVPEINPEDIKWHRGLIANPNCSTIQMVVALNPIHKIAKIKRVIVSSYQAASGAGRGPVEELKEQTKAILDGKDVGTPKNLPKRIGFNIFPHIGKFEALDYTSEEWKMAKETHKIMHDDKIAITATAVRVPIVNVHCESIYVQTEPHIAVEEIKRILRKAPGIILIDEPDPNAPDSDPTRRLYPMPIDADGKDEVFVGRIRQDPFVKNAFNLWVVADNLRKGAATNAVQIAECVISGS